MKHAIGTTGLIFNEPLLWEKGATGRSGYSMPKRDVDPAPLDDDLKPYFEQIRDADALVLGTPIHAGYMTGWMFSFTTRLSCFSHVKHPLRDKPVILVVTGCFGGTEGHAVQEFARNVSVQSRGAKVMGQIYYTSAIPWWPAKICHIVIFLL